MDKTPDGSGPLLFGKAVMVTRFFSIKEFRKFIRFGNWIEEIHDSKNSLDIIF